MSQDQDQQLRRQAWELLRMWADDGEFLADSEGDDYARGQAAAFKVCAAQLRAALVTTAGGERGER